jgi:hypothetical protein
MNLNLLDTEDYDYTMPEDTESFWVTIGTLSLWVHRLPEHGVSVSLHPRGKEYSPKADLGRLIAYYSDGE